MSKSSNQISNLSEANQNFLGILLHSFEVNNLQPARNYIFDPEKRDDVAAYAFESIGPIHKEMVARDDEDFDKEGLVWLQQLVSLGSPKEMVLGLLEILAEEENLQSCIPLIPLLEYTLLRINVKQVSTVDFTLSSIDNYIKKFPLPEEPNFEDNENLDLHLNPKVQAIAASVLPYVSLLKTFVQHASQVSNNDSLKERSLLLKDSLVHFFLSLMTHPLVFMDLGQENMDFKNTLRIQAEQCVLSLYQLKGYLFTLYEIARQEAEKWEFTNMDLALATVAYLVLAENVSNICPCVYNPWYLLETHLLFANLLLSRTESMLIIKGIKLSETLLSNISSGHLTADCLDLPALLSLPDELFKVMILCPSKQLREKALGVFSCLISRFDSSGCCQLLLALLQSQVHNQARSFLLTLYKNQLVKSLSSGIPRNPFIGLNLEFVLKIAIKLNSSEAPTDFLENSNCLLSALNLLIYVSLKDKQGVLNAKSFLEELPVVFLTPLRNSLNFSKSYFHKEQQAKSISSRAGDLSDIQVNVAGEALSALPSDYETQIQNSAIRTLALIEYAIVHLEESLKI